MLIVTPNPAVDHTVRLARLTPGEVIRADSGGSVAGGKGGNVARAARLLGVHATVLALVPEIGGAHLRALYAAEGIDIAEVPVTGRVRTCTAIIEADARVTLINEPGPAIDADDWARLMALLTQRLGERVGARLGERLGVTNRAGGESIGHDVVVCSGSLPPGAPMAGYAQVVRAGHAAGFEVVVDAGGAALAQAVAAGADLVCPNVSEAEAMLEAAFGHGPGAPHLAEPVDDGAPDIPRRAAAAAAALRAHGARWAAVTAGSAGAALSGPGTTAWLTAPRVAARNPIGAGDSFLAGAVTARLAGRSWPQAVRRGLAAGSASVEQDAAAVLDPARVDELERGIAAAGAPTGRPEP